MNNEYLQLISLVGRLLVALVIGTGTICATIAGTYYSLIRRLDKQDNDRYVIDLKLQALQVQVDKLELDIKDLKNAQHLRKNHGTP